MKTLLAAALTLSAATVAVVVVDQTGPKKDGSIKLVSGQSITPAGSLELLTDTVQSMALSPDGATLAVVSGGAQVHNLYLLDAKTGKKQKTIALGRAQSSGLAWSADGATVYVPGGASESVHLVSVATGERTDIKLPGDGDFQSGLVLLDSATLVVADLKNNAIHKLRLPSGEVLATQKLDADNRPGCLRLAPDKSALYVALWGDATVLELDPATLSVRRKLTAGRHPNDMVVTSDRIFVSCANDDSVVVLDRASGEKRETLVLKPTPTMPAGVTPSGLTLSKDGKTLYVACSDLNAVAVADVASPGHSVVKGFVPAAHYPTTVALSSDEKTLFIGSAKGLGTGPNAKPREPDQPIKEISSYITLLLKGVVQTCPSQVRRSLPRSPSKSPRTHRSSPA